MRSGDAEEREAEPAAAPAAKGVEGQTLRRRPTGQLARRMKPK